MSLYNSLLSKAEDIYLAMLSKKKGSEVKECRPPKEQLKFEGFNENLTKNIKLKKAIKKEQVEGEKTKQLLIEQDRQKTLSLFYHFDQTADIKENSYEFLEIKRNYPFFLTVKNEVFDEEEYGYSFLDCTFNETKTQNYRGYLIVTYKRILFVSEDFSIIKKFSFASISNVRSLNNMLLENNLIFQYGKRHLEFNKSSDFEQVKKAGSFIRKFSNLSI